jgi:hypothetical protein
MKIKSLFGLFLIALVLFSCKKELEPQESSDAIPNVQPVTEQLPMTTTPQVVTQTSTPQQTQMQTNAVAAQPNPAVTQQIPAPTAKGMNPAHGQPGHRCDIAVGAPLNSPPGKKAAAPAAITQTTVQPTMTVPAAQTAASTTAVLKTDSEVVTAPGMNPPHGKEGHRCDVAVGAPLPKTE